MPEQNKREEEGSTGIGEGIAIPHAKTDAVATPGLASMIVRQGVDYESLDDEPAYLFFMIAAPAGGANIHLEVLSRLSRMLMDDDFREKLMQASSADEYLQIITDAETVQLAEDAKRIKDNNVNATFYMTSIRAWPAENRVDIRGELKTWIGDSKPYSEIKSYVIQFSRVDGVSWLARFGEINNEKN